MRNKVKVILLNVLSNFSLVVQNSENQCLAIYTLAVIDGDLIITYAAMTTRRSYGPARPDSTLLDPTRAYSSLNPPLSDPAET